MHLSHKSSFLRGVAGGLGFRKSPPKKQKKNNKLVVLLLNDAW